MTQASLGRAKQRIMGVSIFNRAIVVLAAIVVLGGAVITLLVTAGAVTPDILPYGWFESSLQRAADASGGTAAATITVSVIIGLAMIAVLLFEFMPYRRRVLLLISSDDAGTSTIDQESVRLLAEKTAVAAPDVRDARCTLAGKADGLSISCWTSVALGTNIPEISGQLQGKIKEAVEEFTGLSVRQVNVTSKYEALAGRRLAVR